MHSKILILSGDGIGPEITAQAEKIIRALQVSHGLDVELLHGLVGGAAVDMSGSPCPDETLQMCQQSDAALFGAIGGPAWDNLPRPQRPETGLLSLRSQLDLFANLRPVVVFPELVGASTLRPDIVRDLDLLIVRELTGGIYFGEPRGIEPMAGGELSGFNTMRYSQSEIRRIAELAFSIAGKRQRRLCSVDKANVLEVSELWRNTVSEVAAACPEIELQHMYVDNAAMQLVRAPRQFDIMLTPNMFGDILSDLAAMLSGSIGMLPSASINSTGFGLYEPIHGAAPDIAGKDQANPLAAILSLAMLLRFSLNRPEHAQRVENAVRLTLQQGIRTVDIATPGDKIVGTEAMGDAVASALQ